MNIKKVIKSIVEWIIYIVIFIVIVWGTPKILVKALHTDYPIASITSGSMWPALKQGDIVFIKGVAGKNDVTIGDIVVYRNAPGMNPGQAPGMNPGQEGFTIHRVIEMGETTLTTKGDANNISDPPVEYSRLVGKAVTWRGHVIRIPYLGQLSNVIRREK